MLIRTSPEGVLRFIASGVFGSAAFTGGSNMIFTGLLFHFLKSKITTGILYGIFIWIVMNLSYL